MSLSATRFLSSLLAGFTGQAPRRVAGPPGSPSPLSPPHRAEADRRTLRRVLTRGCLLTFVEGLGVVLLLVAGCASTTWRFVGSGSFALLPLGCRFGSSPSLVFAVERASGPPVAACYGNEGLVRVWSLWWLGPTDHSCCARGPRLLALRTMLRYVRGGCGMSGASRIVVAFNAPTAPLFDLAPHLHAHLVPPSYSAHLDHMNWFSCTLHRTINYLNVWWIDMVLSTRPARYGFSLQTIAC